MATVVITSSDELIKIVKSGEAPYRFPPGIEAAVRNEGTSINIISNVVPLITFDFNDDITVNGTPLDQGSTTIDEFCDQLTILFPDANTGSGGPGTVSTDDTLTGDGSPGTPLGINATETLQVVTDRGNTTSNDIEITDFTKGIILTTSDNTRGRIMLQKDGDGSLRLLLSTLMLLFFFSFSLKAQITLIPKDTLNLSYRIDTVSTYLNADNFYGRLSGLIVSYSGSGLTFNVTAGYFRLRDGALRHSNGGSITLDAADATNARWDIIGVDINGNIIKKTGSASATPSVPQLDDPESQLELTLVEILANETTPSTITQNIIYDENSGDAFTGTNTGVTVNYDNATNVQHGSKSADVGSWTAGHTITFTKNSGTFNASDYSVLPFFIKLKSSIANNANIRISFLNGTQVVSNVITLGNAHGFNKTNTNYQNVSVPISAFTFTSTIFNKVRITLAGTGVGFYLDYMQLQSGLNVSSPETDPVANAKTVSLIQGYGIIIPQSITQALNTNPTFTPTIDTFAITTRNWLYKVADSLGAIINASSTKFGTATDASASATRDFDNNGFNFNWHGADTLTLSADNVLLVDGVNKAVLQSIDTAQVLSNHYAIISGDSVNNYGASSNFWGKDNALGFKTDAIALYANGLTFSTNPARKFVTIDTTNGKLNYSIFPTTVMPSGGTTGQVLTKNSNTDYDYSWSSSSNPTAANPTASIGLTTQNGSASTFMRSDAAPALDQSIAPTWTSAHVFNRNGLNGNRTPDLTLQNSTASTSLVKVQVSPALYWEGHGWNTAGAGSDKTHLWYNYVVPISTTFSQSKWVLGAIIDATTTDFVTVTNANGNATATLNVTGTVSGSTASFTTGTFGQFNGAPIFDQQLNGTPSQYARFNGNSQNLTLQNGGAFYGAQKGLLVLYHSGQAFFGQSGSSTSGSSTVTNTGVSGADFRNQFKPGDNITIGGETHTIQSITDASHLTTTTNWTSTFTNQGYSGNAYVGAIFKENGQLGIGTATPDFSSVLDITSTTQGVLLPRMTKAQRDAIVSPAIGLMIYQTDNTPGLRVYNGTNWMRYTETAD